GLAKNTDWPHGLYVKGSLAPADWLNLTVQRVGTQYRRQFNYNIFDVFDRDLADGSTSAGLEFNKDINSDWFVKATGDYTRPADITTTSFHLGRNFGTSASWELVYQTYDAARSLGLRSSFSL
ncbi:MAG: hypothetical protein PHG97_02165, partial [Candidatus Margulisbacteria bacterium]|nr:hypothetical protein [Candidatus Margulisiibacteriota bacterium]